MSSQDDDVNINADNFYSSNIYSLKYLIAMRYHACIWAGIHGIPFIALSYDKKITLLASQLGQPCVEINPKESLVETLSLAWENYINHYDQLKVKLETNILKLIQASNINEKVLVCQR